MTPAEQLSEIIRARRAELHMDQQGYADHIGISRSSLQRLEWGAQSARLWVVELIVRDAGRTLTVGPQGSPLEVGGWGEVATAARQASGLTVMELTRDPGIGKGQWAHWRRGISPLLSSVAKVCEALGFRYRIG